MNCEQEAISVKSVAFSYNKANAVLKSVTLSVEKGQIYSLLGSNGCGKTTLIKILTGRLRAQKGEVRILGHELNPRSAHLSHFIGYMPQEIALNPYMYIEDTFNYFARVNHIHDRDFIRKQIENYLSMLDLKDPKQMVCELSGGQKRLLSLGVTMIYEPKILFLDEPTVGVDSLIRAKIWDHLRVICNQKQTTVLITTHYIDEAKQSNLVGFLKQGQMLIEDSPYQLMEQLQCQTLEEVFYKVSMQKIKQLAELNGHRRLSADPNNNHFTHVDLNTDSRSSIASEGSVVLSEKLKVKQNKLDIKQYPCINSFINIDHLSALMYRETLISKTGLIMLIYYILIPVFTSYLFYSSYGRPPKNLPVAIFNSDTATENRLSDLYLRQLTEDEVRLRFYHSKEDAIESVRLGRNIMSVTFPRNFTETFTRRYKNVNDLLNDNKFLRESSLNIVIDGSNLLNERFLNRTVLKAFRDLADIFTRKHFVNPTAYMMPVAVEEVVYGTMEPKFEDFFLAGILVVVQFALNMMKTALSFGQLKSSGSMNRDFIQGVKPTEMFVTFEMATLSTMFIQVIVMAIYIFGILGMQLEGNVFLIIFLMYTISIQGSLIGALITTFFENSTYVLIVAFTINAVVFFTSGALWPVESMSNNLQRLFIFNPTVLTIQSIRRIILCGFSLPASFIVNIVNCVALFLIQLVCFHYKNTV